MLSAPLGRSGGHAGSLSTQPAPISIGSSGRTELANGGQGPCQFEAVWELPLGHARVSLGSQCLCASVRGSLRSGLFLGQTLARPLCQSPGGGRKPEATPAETLGLPLILFFEFYVGLWVAAISRGDVRVALPG